MTAERDLLDTTGLVCMLRDPNTGEVLTLNFPPGAREIPLEIHFPARIAEVKLRVVPIRDGGEYDVRLVLDTNPPTFSTNLREVLMENSMKDLGLPTETVTRTEAPLPRAPFAPDSLSAFTPDRSQNTPYAPALNVEPSVPLPGQRVEPARESAFLPGRTQNTPFANPLKVDPSVPPAPPPAQPQEPPQAPVEVAAPPALTETVQEPAEGASPTETPHEPTEGAEPPASTPEAPSTVEATSELGKSANVPSKAATKATTKGPKP